MTRTELTLSAEREAKRQLIKDLKEALVLAREIDRQADCIIDIVEDSFPQKRAA